MRRLPQLIIVYPKLLYLFYLMWIGVEIVEAEKFGDEFAIEEIMSGINSS